VFYQIDTFKESAKAPVLWEGACETNLLDEQQSCEATSGAGCFHRDLQDLTTESSLTLSSTSFKPLQGHPVLRPPQQVRLHRALDELGWTVAIDELNNAAVLNNQSVPKPILITQDGTIVAGFGRWRLALFEGRQHIHCIEYELSEEDSLRFMLAYHQPEIGWNRFVRTCLALRLERSLQQKALDNMRVGGKCKGSAILPDLQHIDVRQAISAVAGVGARTVGNVKTILKNAHPRLIEALQNGTLTINRAVQFCRFPKTEQLAQYANYSTERSIQKVLKQAFPEAEKDRVSQDVVSVLDALRTKALQQPGSVLIRSGRHQHTIVLVGRGSTDRPLEGAEVK